MAMKKMGPDVEVIFHSDRGSQYASKAYRNFLKNRGIRPSMSRKGNCYDNAYVESWFGSLKKEWIYRKVYSNEEELRTSVFEYIEVWYNKKRKHSSLGYYSPVKYRNINKKIYKNLVNVKNKKHVCNLKHGGKFLFSLENSNELLKIYFFSNQRQ